MEIPENIKKAIDKLAGSRVRIGIPQDSKRKGGDPMDNATLGWIHETGSPAQNIPARPFLRPGVTGSRDQWEPYLRQAAEAAYRGDETVMDQALNAAGGFARDAVKLTITDRIPPPVTEQTVRRSTSTGRRTGPVSGAVPLVDTAQLLNSITYVVEYS